MKKLIHLSLSLLLLGGCATVADLRSAAPDEILKSPLLPQKIANCVLYQAPAEAVSWAADYNFTMSELPPGTYHVLASVNGGWAGEADFKPMQNGGSTIELRARPTFWAKASFWACIQKCASQNIPEK